MAKSNQLQHVPIWKIPARTKEQDARWEEVWKKCTNIKPSNG